MKLLSTLASDSYSRRSVWNLVPSRLGPRRSLLPIGAVLLLATAHLLFWGLPARAENSEGAITGLMLTSETPGTLTATWDPPTTPLLVTTFCSLELPRIKLPPPPILSPT